MDSVTSTPTASLRVPVEKRKELVLSARRTVATFGRIMIPFLRSYEASGRLRVLGYERYLTALRRGKTLIVANHPGVVESVILSTLLYREFDNAPEDVWPFAMPDPTSFIVVPRRFWHSIYPRIRCIPVVRKDGESRKAAGAEAMRLLHRFGEVLVMHPEGGRTVKGTSFLEGPHGRRMRTDFEKGTLRFATIPGVQILPVWVEFNGSPILEKPVPYWRLWWRGLTVHVGHPFELSSSMKQDVRHGGEGEAKAIAFIQQKIFHAGLSDDGD